MNNFTSQLLSGKKGIVTGIANNMSIAYEIAKICINQGAQIALTYPNEVMQKRVLPIAEELGAEGAFECDVTSDESIKSLCENVEKKFGKIDFLIHSIAFADKNELRGKYVNTTRENFKNSMDISAYSLTALMQYFDPLFNDNSSVVTLTYMGSNKVIPCYNVMGVAKAALEASVRYLAHDFGDRNIRVNAISAGPIRTLAASGIGDFKSMLNIHQNTAPLKRNTTQEDVAKSTLYFLSDLSSGVTGEIHYVDSGYNIMGLKI